jgi:hypothetical protein
MESIEIVPLVGAGAIQLGMARAAVHAALGQPVSSFLKSSTSRYPTDTWFSSGFQVFYTGNEPTVEYIELSAGCGFEATCLNQPIFSTRAKTLVQRFTEHAALDTADSELGNSYVFPALEMALWRPIADEPEGAFFSTIGVGVRGYFT